MRSELVVVLVLTALAAGFIIWVRMSNRGHEPRGESARVAKEGEGSKD